MKVLNILLETYPELLKNIPILATNLPNLEFPKNHAVSSVLGILPRLINMKYEVKIGFSDIINIFNTLHVTGFARLMIFRDIL